MKNAYDTPQFLDETAALDLVQECIGFRWLDGAAEFTYRMHRVQPQVYDSYGTRYENLYLPEKDAGVATVRLDFCTPEILRVRFAPGMGVPNSSLPARDPALAAENTPMVVGRFTSPVDVAVEETNENVTLATASVVVVVDKSQWGMRMYAVGRTARGQEVFATRSRKIPTVKPSRLVDFNPEWYFHNRYAYPLGLARRMGEDTSVFESFDLAHDEGIYGLGERYLRLNKHGQKVTLWQEEVYNNTSSGAYKNVPFYVSTRGYGLFLNTAYPVTVRAGDLTDTACSVIIDHCDMLDYYLIYGPGIREILPRYTSITGAPGLPPKWSFGHWMGRLTYSSQAEVEQVADELRAHAIPTDVIHIDTGWYSVIGNCDLKFDPERFPDPEGMFRRLREKGYHVSLWQTPNVAVDNCLYAELKESGALIKRHDGAPYHRAGYVEDCAMPDLSNPAAVAVMREKYAALLRMGASAIKVDFGEGAPTDGLYHNYPGWAMRNLYPLLYNRTVFEITGETLGRGNAIIWARSAWAGCQRYPLHWSGDGVAAWRDLPCTLRSGLSFGLSGFVFWSHDVGGFIGNPTPELYARWIQVGAFTSHCRAHGEPPREPWHYGERTEAIYRQYLDLRYRLLPYIYSQAVECVRQSLPMLRALVIDFQDDPATENIDDEYLFGGSILVAPVMTPENRRRVYLPRGAWVDYWTKQAVAGGQWLDVEAPLETLPLYVRAGAVIPMGPVQQYVDEKPLDPLTVEIYAPAGEGSFTIHDPEKPEIAVRYTREGKGLAVEVDGAPGAVEVLVFPGDGSRQRAEFDGRRQSRVELQVV